MKFSETAWARHVQVLEVDHPQTPAAATPGATRAGWSAQTVFSRYGGARGLGFWRARARSERDLLVAQLAGVRSCR